MKTSRLRLQRAGEHIDKLDSEITDFLVEGDSYAMPVQRNTRPVLEDVYYFRVLKPVPVDQFGLLISDSLHSLRAALDNLIWDLAPADVKADEKRASSLQFPIFDDPKRYAEKAPSYLAGICDDAVKMVDKHGPHKRPMPAGHPLSQMAQLSNLDKHRFIHPSFWLLQGALIVTHGFGRATLHPQVNTGRLEDGGEVARIRILEGPETYHKPDFTIEISFDETGPAGGQAVRTALREFHYYIDKVLLPDFKQFF